jgi:hypothetical protein
LAPPKFEKQVTHLLFVGESRSPTAIEKGWTWRSGHLAARTLHAALEAAGFDPMAHEYVNLWPDPPRAQAPTRHRCLRIREHAAAGGVVVALGAKVAAGLAQLGVPHVALVHPAARGKIRARALYQAHVREALVGK